MANTGIKQAVVAYKVRASDGAPLDIFGKLISVSGRRQAVAVLEGRGNPDSILYEIERYFPVRGELSGAPTFEISSDCPKGYILLSPDNILLSPGNPVVSVTLASSGSWGLMSSAGPYVTISPTSGGKGSYTLTFTRTPNIGQGAYTFRNTETLETFSIYVINVNAVIWILASGNWDSLGIWTNTGIWNY